MRDLGHPRFMGMVDAMIVRILIFGLFGAAVALVAMAMARRNGWGINLCPHCNSPVPFLRRSWSLRQILWGGYTCLVCGSEFDSWGGDVSPVVKIPPKGTVVP
jgi:hypothetical protein